MKHSIMVLILCMTSIGVLCACTAKTAPMTWDEQYDLGIRYLDEGNYEEAIIAFSAAIEIDPKRAPAYVGRGDAYVLSGETDENLSAAQADYELAITLDETLAAAYLGLAEIYVCRGNYDEALKVLDKGYGITGDIKIATKIEQLKGREGQQYIKDAKATFIANIRTYKDDVNAHMDLYGDLQGFMMYGIKFSPSIEFEKGAKVVEANLTTMPSELSTRLGNHEFKEFYNWELFDTEVTVSGYMYYNENYQSVTLLDDGIYLLNPNGPYCFDLQEWRFTDNNLS